MSCVALLAICLTACAVGASRPATTPDSASGRAPGGTSSTAVTDDAAFLAAADALLSARERAVLAQDHQGYAELLADPEGAPGARLRGEFATLSQLPIQVLTHGSPRSAGSDPTTSPPPASSSAVSGSSTDPARTVVVPTTWRLRGERADSHAEERFTLVRQAATWKLLDHRARVTPAAPWWAAGSNVVATTHGVVIGTGPAGEAQSLAALLDRAAVLAAEAWPTSGSQPPLIVVAPSSTAEYARLSGASAAASAQVGAITDGPLDAAGRAVADRIVLNPDAFARLTPDGRAFVLAHEAAHVQLRADLAGQAPLWLSEGFADWVAYGPTGLPPTVIARQALDQVRAGEVPDRLPRQGDFDPSATSLAPTYQRCWVLVAWLVQTYRIDRVHELIRAATVLGSQADADAAADRALQEVLGTSGDRLLTQWQQRLRELAAQG